MAEKSWNKNVRFNRNSESAMQAWSLLHSDEVEKEFKSQNEFVICAINDYYERHLRIRILKQGKKKMLLWNAS